MKKKVLILLIMMSVAGGIFGIHILNRVEHRDELTESSDKAGKTISVDAAYITNSIENAGNKKQLPDVINILLIGVDNHDQNTMDFLGNSDGIMLASINTKTEEVIFTSFLRGTRVRVNDAYYDMLTTVYHSGGVELLKKTFEDNFDIHVDYYAIFNYLDVIDIVDSVGGVQIQLSADELYFMEDKIINLTGLTNTSYEDNTLADAQPGLVNLTGLQAAAYMRIRPAEGNYDFGRTERTRNIVSKVLSKLYNMELTDMLRFFETIYGKIKTDIPAELMFDLFANAEEIKAYNQIMDRIPIDGSYSYLDEGSGAYIVPDFEVNNRHLRESIYEGIHEVG